MPAQKRCARSLIPVTTVRCAQQRKPRRDRALAPHCPLAHRQRTGHSVLTEGRSCPTIFRQPLQRFIKSFCGTCAKRLCSGTLQTMQCTGPLAASDPMLHHLTAVIENTGIEIHVLQRKVRLCQVCVRDLKASSRDTARPPPLLVLISGSGKGGRYLSAFTFTIPSSGAWIFAKDPDQLGTSCSSAAVWQAPHCNWRAAYSVWCQRHYDDAPALSLI